MKRVIVICLICVLSACASTGSSNLSDKGKNSRHLSQRQLNESGYDEAYMARMERAAAQNGIILRWVNPPKAPKAKKDGR